MSTAAEWSRVVAVTLHYIPEDEGYEGGYEAVTVSGVPHSVKITGTAHNSKEEALDHLRGGLRAFGFAGRILVHDATLLGHSEQYEIEISY